MLTEFSMNVKARYIVLLYVIVRLNFKKDKRPVKYLRTEVQVK